MLEQFIIDNRDLILERTSARAAARRGKKSSELELANGVPVFLNQLVEALRHAGDDEEEDRAQIDRSASLHGSELLRLGLTIGQVVHCYGDVCQSVTQLAIEQGVELSGRSFQTLNLCLDDAIAAAVTEHARLRELRLADLGTERLGELAHELRNMLNTATLTFDSIQSGSVAPGGSTGMVHHRALCGLRHLIDRSLAEVRLDAGLERRERFSAAELAEEVEIGAALEAHSRGMHLDVAPVDRDVMIEGDRPLLAAALSNLLHNALKFTHADGHVGLSALASNDRVLFEIRDECGGLPGGDTESLFRPFSQGSGDRSGVGLGLSICRKAASANDGQVRVRDLPGEGCIFTLDLPRSRSPSPGARGVYHPDEGEAPPAPR